MQNKSEKVDEDSNKTLWSLNVFDQTQGVYLGEFLAALLNEEHLRKHVTFMMISAAVQMV